MKSTRTVLSCAALILMVAMGVRQTMGVFLPPMTIANGWTRDEFAFAIALQNLLWGAFVPFAGVIADRFGAGRVLVASALAYILGLVLMALSSTPLAFDFSAGLVLRLPPSRPTLRPAVGGRAEAGPPAERHRP